jgi:hypothetical protein
MSGRGKGAAGYGKGGTKRHRKVVRESIKGNITVRLPFCLSPRHCPRARVPVRAL